MPQFVVLRHECPRGLHWDLMLQCDGVLKTWALAQPPDECGQVDRERIDAERLPDHRLAYLDYEGPISGDRGDVIRYEFGRYEILSRNDTEWIVEIVGERLVGRARLRQVDDDPQRWAFMFSSSAG